MPFIKNFFADKGIDYLNIFYAGNKLLVPGGMKKMKSFIITFKAKDSKEEILKKINVAAKSISL